MARRTCTWALSSILFMSPGGKPTRPAHLAGHDPVRGQPAGPGALCRKVCPFGDRELHDSLLEDVLAADPQVHGLTLQNTYAQEQAEALLADADDYF